MIYSMGLSMSGIRAAFGMMDSSAHNTANISTDGFKKLKTRLVEGAGGGVETYVEKSDARGPLYLSSEGRLIEASNVDYVEELSTQIIARHLLSFNVKALQTADEMQKTLLDLFA